MIGNGLHYLEHITTDIFIDEVLGKLHTLLLSIAKVYEKLNMLLGCCQGEKGRAEPNFAEGFVDDVQHNSGKLKKISCIDWNVLLGCGLNVMAYSCDMKGKE